MGKSHRGVYCATLIFLVALTFSQLLGFSLKKIKGPLLEGEAPHSSSEIHKLLQQPYFYLSKGHQCFVFVSEDGKTVIKFFNYNRFRFPSWAVLTPDLKAYAKKRKDRFQLTFDSLQIARAFLREETGLIELHLQKSTKLPILTLFDELDRCHLIDLNNFAFILQKRAVPLKQEIEQRVPEEVIDAYCLFLRKRCEKMIADDDRDVMCNFGFHQNELLNLDPGRLFFSEKLRTTGGIEREVRVATKRLRQHLKKSHPEALPYLQLRQQELIDFLSQTNITDRDC